MRVVRVSPAGRARSAAEIFRGHVATQTVIDEGSRDLRLIEVAFKSGARNRLHVHSTDQILVITEGTGLVGTASEQHEVTIGDVAFIPAGEPHWHGAKPGHDLTHWSMTGQAQTRIVGD